MNLCAPYEASPWPCKGESESQDAGNLCTLITGLVTSAVCHLQAAVEVSSGELLLWAADLPRSLFSLQPSFAKQLMPLSLKIGPLQHVG